MLKQAIMNGTILACLMLAICIRDFPFPQNLLSNKSRSIIFARGKRKSTYFAFNGLYNVFILQVGQVILEFIIFIF